MSSPILIHVSVNAVIQHNDQILLLRMNRPEHKKGLWGFAGGKVSQDESFEAALQREVAEETGIQPDQYEVLSHQIVHQAPHAACKHVYRLKLNEFVSNIIFDPKEIIEAKWFNLDDHELQHLQYRASWILPLLETSLTEKI